ncbi:MAG TPA: hypothetical protein PK984_04040 [Paludibacteraceae bacterium]|jgi:hypothetical protein|nr:hypothetical protein [Paludibacteraceae bacterium]HOS37368.1 hypothetical protein [Paludibacteraceae bacterium]HPK21061.1 hypothetical protein [Paludibacteraceae bacterium]HPO48361.1 hypothetical protein [Paludibacteraceae bacterium]HPW95436.1 hypothetical protein [Paludibacteraceae bacterium]
MVPIVINEKQQFDEEGFKDFFIQKCKQHKSEGRALAFAFIVYDFENHTITNILKDKNYWSALDKISGNMLSVFYINSQDKLLQQATRTNLSGRITTTRKIHTKWNDFTFSTNN